MPVELSWLLLALRPLLAVGLLGFALQLPRFITFTLAVSAALLTAPMATVDATALQPWQWLMAASRELAIGATMGIVASVPLWAVRTAGAGVDSALAAVRSGGSGTRSYQMLWSLCAAMIFFASHGPALVFGQLARSYQALPVAGSALAVVAPIGNFTTTVLGSLSSMFALALPMALPVLLTVLTLTVAGHVSARVAGHANVSPVVAGALPLAALVAVAALYSLTAHYVGRMIVAALTS